jgi:hypothetical protein
MVKVNGKVLDDASIDYASISYARPPYMVEEMVDKILQQRLRVISQSETQHRAYLYGYAGYRAPHAFVGASADRVLELVSGSIASHYDLCRDRVDVHVNRLDIQVTLLLAESDSIGAASSVVEQEIDKLHQHIASYRLSAKGAMRRLTYSRVTSVSPDGNNPIVGSTLYIGSRTSSMFLRIYNKTAEARIGDSKATPALLRLEIEAKNAYAEQIRTDCLRMPEYKLILMAEILRRYDIDIDVARPVKQYRLATQARSSRDTDGTLKWLRHAVAPTIERLLANGIDRDELIRILFGQES